MWYPEGNKARVFPQFKGDSFEILGATVQRGDIFVIVAPRSA